MKSANDGTRNHPNTSIEGIVLKQSDFGENHRIVSIIDKTRGRFDFAAFGVSSGKSRRRSALLAGNIISGIVHTDSRANGWSLTEARAENCFDGIREDYSRSALLFLILEMLYIALQKDQPFSEYDLLIETLKKIESKPRPEKYALSFLYDLLRSEGIFPEYSQGFGEQINHYLVKTGKTDFALGNGSLRFIKDSESVGIDYWDNKELSISVMKNLVELLEIVTLSEYEKKLLSTELIRFD